MIFKINKREFLDSLTTAVKAISNTTPLPILNGIKLIAENNTLTLISSDTNISILLLKTVKIKKSFLFQKKEKMLLNQDTY